MRIPGRTLPTAGELVDMARDYAAVSQNVIRLLNNEIKFEKNLKIKEVKTKIISASE